MGKKRSPDAAASKRQPGTAGGQVGARGYLVQTLIALRDLLDEEHAWTSVTIEPNLAADPAAPDQPAADQPAADKVDILWRYRAGTRAVQVKSSRNPFRQADIERWAGSSATWRRCTTNWPIRATRPCSRPSWRSSIPLAAQPSPSPTASPPPMPWARSAAVASRF